MLGITGKVGALRVSVRAWMTGVDAVFGVGCISNAKEEVAVMMVVNER